MHRPRHAVNEILLFSRLWNGDATLICPARDYTLKFSHGVVAYVVLVILQEVRDVDTRPH